MIVTYSELEIIDVRIIDAAPFHCYSEEFM